MDKHLDTFIAEHPEGWNHDAWLTLLTTLEQDGIDVSDAETIGYELENRRLAAELRRREIAGLGPKRIEALVERFGTLWSLQHADTDQLTAIKTVPANLAEKVVAAVR